MLVDVARVWLAIVFGVAGGLKIYRPARAKIYVSRLISVSTRLATGIVILTAVAELAVAVCLVSGTRLLPVAATAALLLIGFTVLLAVDRGDETSDCGCFGDVSDGVPRSVNIARNVVLLCGATFVTWSARSAPERYVGDVVPILLGILSTVVFGITYIAAARLASFKIEG